MVLCIVAMVVFGILGIFSVGYRKLAWEAFQCTFRTITFRPCESNLDQRMKYKILSWLMGFPRLARFVNKQFAVISWIFVILFFASMAYSGYAVYNLIVYKTCDPQHPQNCVFTPLLNSTDSTQVACQIENNFIEFYGQECPHCRNMMSIVEQVEGNRSVTFDKLEVWHNETNYNLMQSHAGNITKWCKQLGVPTFYSQKTGNAICGETSYSTLEKFIIENG